MKLPRSLARVSVIASIVVTVTATLFVPFAQATIGQITSFNTTTGASQPRGVVAGPDGNTWFTECNNGAAVSVVGKITPAGVVTEYPTTTASACPTGITVGPDNNLWFTERSANKIGKITTAGAMTEFAAGGGPEEIVTGPDGNLWYTRNTGNAVSKMSTAGVNLNTYALAAGSNPYGIASGPDGRLWVAETGRGSGNGAIAAVDTAGAINTYPVSCNGCASPQEITNGPDGNLWFTESAWNGAFPAVGVITTAGVATEAIVPNGSQPWGIAMGPDNNLWFTDNGAGFVGRYNPTSGNFTEFVDPAGNAVEDIASGPDGNMWVAGGAGGSQQLLRVRLSWYLSLTLNGTGFGSVTSSPSGIDCPATTCTQHFIEGTQVTLTAAPQPGSRFVGWTGVPGCSGTGTCTVTMNAAKSVTATFNAIYQLTTAVAGSGTGTLTASPDPQGLGQGPEFAVIDCPGNCSTYYDKGSVVTVNQVAASSPSSGSRFTGWSGDCAGTGVCTVTMNAAHSVTANYVQTWVLTVQTAGTGGGTVTASPTGINPGISACSGTCTGQFDDATLVTVTEAPDGISKFTGWGGACSGTGTCQVTMSAVRDVTATFIPSLQPDASIGYGAKSLVGDNVYNNTGANQTATGKVRRGATGIFNVTVQNDGKAADTFQLHGAPKTAGFVVNYYAGASKITTQVTTGAYTTASIPVLGTTTFQIRVTVSKKAPLGATFNDLLMVSSVTDPTSSDAVKAVVKAK